MIYMKGITGGEYMLTQYQINKISNILALKAREIFGDKLKDVILFGSFARGNASNESDIDIMLLVDMDRTNLSQYKNEICKISSDLGMQFNVLISPILQGIDEFNKFKNDLPFFRNVTHEGVRSFIRNESDYSDFYIASKGEAEEQSENAARFYEEVVKYLESKNG